MVEGAEHYTDQTQCTCLDTLCQSVLLITNGGTHFSSWEADGQARSQSVMASRSQTGPIMTRCVLVISGVHPGYAQTMDAAAANTALQVMIRTFSFH